ncbi:aminoglycoside phosphotransferase family protein [Ensifer sp. Root278]|uniref:aminoglycoside phosphotransferase family protein n=1 Tax=Ensifer sp. Root278 TaxID=1736509 RepID=UPI00138F36C9|nr:aminoglycoside phosphotransferase family protein [Ensifer sp. Root278]
MASELISLPGSEKGDERPLAGGNVNAGVVRVGDTVRRATAPQSASVHRLLLHLEARGFQASPRFLGLDDRGREVLSFLDGEAGGSSEIWLSERALTAAAALLRAYHDATADFEFTAADLWASRDPDQSRSEVVCHNDFAPYNLIFRGGEPVGVIDFDLAGPGPRLRDLAYLAYWMVPLSFHTEELKVAALADLDDGSRRLKRFCETYGLACDDALLAMVVEVLRHMGDEAAMLAMIGAAATERLKRDGHLDHWQREREAFERHRALLSLNIA